MGGTTSGVLAVTKGDGIFGAEGFGSVVTTSVIYVWQTLYYKHAALLVFAIYVAMNT